MLKSSKSPQALTYFTDCGLDAELNQHLFFGFFVPPTGAQKQQVEMVQTEGCAVPPEFRQTSSEAIEAIRAHPALAQLYLVESHLRDVVGFN